MDNLINVLKYVCTRSTIYIWNIYWKVSPTVCIETNVSYHLGTVQVMKLTSFRHLLFRRNALIIVNSTTFLWNIGLRTGDEYFNSTCRYHFPHYTLKAFQKRDFQRKTVSNLLLKWKVSVLSEKESSVALSQLWVMASNIFRLSGGFMGWELAKKVKRIKRLPW